MVVHGIKNDTNAHHISNDGNFIVHNELLNHVIKEHLIKGYKFYSQTDSEVFVALVSTHYNENKNKIKIKRK